MTSATALYTPEVLALATSLSQWPWDAALPLMGSARSKSCGSTIELGLATDAEGLVCDVALRSRACAIGQAAAAIFASAAKGRSAVEVAEADGAIEAWLAGSGSMPDWPGLAAIAPARDFPARHGAIRLAWKAARELLPSG